MKTPILFVGCLFLFLRTAAAQDVAPIQTVTASSVHTESAAPSVDLAATPLDEEGLRVVAKGTVEKTLTKRLIMVLDVSGSMKAENKIGRLLQAAKLVMSNGSDDLEVAIFAFTSNYERWEGVPEPNSNPPLPAGWARLPSAIATTQAQHWITSRASGDTSPDGALRAAIMEPRDDISVLFVSDGDFDGPSAVRTLRKAQQDRVASGRHEVPLMVYGVGAGVDQHAHMSALGAEGGVGFWVDKNLPKLETPATPYPYFRHVR